MRRFATPAAFRRWLRAHHDLETALVLRIAKAHAAESGITYLQALDEALCYWWIDWARCDITVVGGRLNLGMRHR
jgi:uncharacterized protein YdeI (YjbR/CyaY-like superfamily)